MSYSKHYKMEWESCSSLKVSGGMKWNILTSLEAKVCSTVSKIYAYNMTNATVNISMTQFVVNRLGVSNSSSYLYLYILF